MNQSADIMRKAKYLANQSVGNISKTFGIEGNKAAARRAAAELAALAEAEGAAAEKAVAGIAAAEKAAAEKAEIGLV